MTKTEITPHSIYWIRQDLRVSDNPALAKAAEAGYLAIYIFDDVNTDEQTLPGEATSWWLHNSLKAFNKSLDDKISFFRGDPLEILKDLSEKYNINNIFWNRLYEPWMIDRDTKIKDFFQSSGINVESYNASLLWEPWEVHKDDGTPYMVFSPFFKKGCLNACLLYTSDAADE